MIAMIHRQETVNFLGVPVSSYLNIEDSEEEPVCIRRFFA
jgi:Serine dehydrogenase proteinase